MTLLGVDPRTTQHGINPLFHPLIRQLQTQLSEQRQQISQLQTRYDTLARETEDEAHARRADAAEVALLKAQLSQLKHYYRNEGSRVNVGTNAAASNPTPSSMPLVSPASGTHLEEGVAGEFTRTVSVTTSKADLSPPESSPHTGLLCQYAAEIPLVDREAMRARMLRDRGPHRTSLPLLRPQPVNASLQEVEQVSRAPSPDADASLLSLLDDGETPPCNSRSLPCCRF